MSTPIFNAAVMQSQLKRARRSIESGESIEQVCDRLARSGHVGVRLAAAVRRELERAENIVSRAENRQRPLEEKGTLQRRVLISKPRAEYHVTKGWRHGRSYGPQDGASQ